MTCPQCSLPIPDNGTTCPSCGAGADQNAASRQTPALWNPYVLAVLSFLLFGPAVGSVILGVNWSRLGYRRPAIFSWICGLLVILVPPCIPSAWVSDRMMFILVHASWVGGVWLLQREHFLAFRHHAYRRAGWLIPIMAGVVASLGLTLMGFPSAAGLVLRDIRLPQSVMSVEQVTETAGPCVVSIDTTWEESTLLVFTQKGGMSGSGVLILTTPTGSYIVTNRHVVDAPAGARNVVRSVLLGSKKLPYEVDSFGKNGVDLAYLKVADPRSDPAQLTPYAMMGDVHVGEECVAIGNALGAGISVTTGIVSRFDEYEGTKLIRTSAPISPGNSGGGLFRRRDGRLIGITTSARRGEGVQNVNFAIPVDYIFPDEDK